MIIVKSPVRISFCSADYPEFFLENGGAFIGGAINKYIYVSVRETPPYEDFYTRLLYSNVEVVQSNSAIEHKAIKAAIEYMEYNRGLELIHMSDLKSKSGLGSSSSFMLCLILGLSTLKGKEVSTIELIEKARFVENKIIGDRIGFQDYFHTAYGGLAFYNIFKKTGEIVRSPLSIFGEKLNDLENHILLVKTNSDRKASEIAATYVDNKDNIRVHCQLRDLCWNIRRSIEDTNWKKLGEYVNESWKIKKTLSDNVSSEEVDGIHKKMMENGAWGFRLIGAGQNGVIMCIAEPRKHDRILNSLSDYKVFKIDFKFTNDGCRILQH